MQPVDLYGKSLEKRLLEFKRDSLSEEEIQSIFDYIDRSIREC